MPLLRLSVIGQDEEIVLYDCTAVSLFCFVSLSLMSTVGGG